MNIWSAFHFHPAEEKTSSDDRIMNFLIVAVLLMGALALAEKQVDPIMFLHKYGYLSPGRSSLNSLSNAIKDFQKMANLPVTGVLDQDTKAQMSSPRCGFTDNLTIKSNMAYFGAWSKWNTRHITYRYDSTYSGMNTATMKSIIKLAFKAWSDITPLTFSETTGRASMTIGFKRGYHNDGNGFDGLGGVLAHAFFPTDGRIHFDADERWSAGRTTHGSKRQTSLFYTAAHEIGHALGLPHVNSRSALMYPYHIDFGNRFQFKMPAIDTNNIRKLYGGKTTSPTGPIKPTNNCYNNHKYCHLWKYRCNFDPIVIKGCRQTCNRC